MSGKYIFPFKRALCLVIVFMACIAIASCGKGGSGGSTPSSLSPMLKNLAINFDDFDLTILANEDRKPFIPFGDMLTETQLNPTFEFYLKAGSVIVSPVDGTIAAVHLRTDSNDYSISIAPNEASAWSLFLDHVLTPVVEVGDSVSAGDAIGQAGRWDENLGRTELQLFNNNDNLSYCPMDYLDPGSASGLETDITDLMRAWEDLEGDPSAYDEDLMDPIGCLAATVQG